MFLDDLTLLVSINELYTNRTSATLTELGSIIIQNNVRISAGKDRRGMVGVAEKYLTIQDIKKSPLGQESL